MDFLLKFALISYAAIVFFTVGLRVSFFNRVNMNLLKLALIFVAVAVPLSFSLIHESLPSRLFVTLIWTSVIVVGFRFGKKIK